MTAEIRKVVLGTRGSELARAQARLVEKAIQAAQPDVTVETKVIATQGDKARVVDPRLRVLGVDRLRVADASVMPTVIAGNTNAPTIMIGEKAAEMIAADNGVGLAEFVGERR